MLEDALDAAARRWSNPSPGQHWWHSATIIRHVNGLICGIGVGGIAGGGVAVLRGFIYPRAISVGCGAGTNEMALLQAGVVEHFDLYEIADARVDQGMEEVRRRGISERLTWHREAADFDRPVSTDLVYWNNALHHMLDVERAVWWSHESGRAFYMNDYVGPNRFQWTEKMLTIADHIRGILGAGPAPRFDPQVLAEQDPTESVASESILPAVGLHIPDAEIRFLGGVVYSLALKGLSLDPGPLLDGLLLVDQHYAEQGLTHYATAFASGSNGGR